LGRLVVFLLAVSNHPGNQTPGPLPGDRFTVRDDSLECKALVTDQKAGRIKLGKGYAASKIRFSRPFDTAGEFDATGTPMRARAICRFFT
jgi:hypothetical protein